MLALASLWKPLTLAAIVAGAVAYRAVLIHQRDAADAQVAQLSAQAAQLNASNQALTAAIAAQNAAVAQLKVQAASATALASVREQAAARTGAGALDAAAARAATLTGTPIASGCDAAIRWGNAQAVGLAGW